MFIFIHRSFLEQFGQLFRIGILVQATDKHGKVGWMIVQMRMMQTLVSRSSSGSCLDWFWRLDIFNLTGDKVFKVQINEAGQVIILTLLVVLIMIGVAVLNIFAITKSVVMILVMLDMLILLMLDMLGMVIILTLLVVLIMIGVAVLNIFAITISVVMILLMLDMLMLSTMILMVAMMILVMMILPLPILVLFSGRFQSCHVQLFSTFGVTTSKFNNWWSNLKNSNKILSEPYE